VEYGFKHALTHDVAYASVPPEDRRALHRRIAESVAALHGDRLTELAPLLARHYSAAEDWELALRYLLRAADSAARSYATREAVALYDEALLASARVTGDAQATTEMAIHQAKSHLYFVLSDFGQSRAAAEVHRDIARTIGDP